MFAITVSKQRINYDRVFAAAERVLERIFAFSGVAFYVLGCLVCHFQPLRYLGGYWQPLSAVACFSLSPVFVSLYFRISPRAVCWLHSVVALSAIFTALHVVVCDIILK
jgi:hypothetical protein